MGLKINAGQVMLKIDRLRAKVAIAKGERQARQSKAKCALDSWSVESPPTIKRFANDEGRVWIADVRR